MTSQQYLAAWERAGRYAAPPIPRAFNLTRGIPDTLPRCRNAIYIAVDDGGVVLYAGRSMRTAAVRLHEHARRPDRAVGWEAVWIVALRDELTRQQVEHVEGRVGRLLRPRDVGWLPRA